MRDTTYFIARICGLLGWCTLSACACAILRDAGRKELWLVAVGSGLIGLCFLFLTSPEVRDGQASS